MKQTDFFKSSLMILLMCFGLTSVWGQITENFDDGLSSSYTTGNVTLNSGTWSIQNVIQEASNASRTGFAARLNDDMVSFLTTPLITNGVGEISFWYRELNSGGGTIQIQTSTDGNTFEDIATQAYSGQTFQNFTFELNQSGNLYIRILADDQAGHLIIDDFSTTSFASSDPTFTANPTS